MDSYYAQMLRNAAMRREKELLEQATKENITRMKDEIVKNGSSDIMMMELNDTMCKRMIDYLNNKPGKNKYGEIYVLNHVNDGTRFGYLDAKCELRYKVFDN